MAIVVHCAACDVSWENDFDPPKCNDENHEWELEEVDWMDDPFEPVDGSYPPDVPIKLALRSMQLAAAQTTEKFEEAAKAIGDAYRKAFLQQAKQVEEMFKGIRWPGTTP